MRTSSIFAAAAAVALLSACAPKAGPASNTAAKATATHEPAAAVALQAGRVDPTAVPVETKMRASRGQMKGVVYTNALSAIYAPEDQKEYSAYDEYGWKKAGDYKTYGAMPAGWWIYSAPYWVIWDLKNGQRGE